MNSQCESQSSGTEHQSYTYELLPWSNMLKTIKQLEALVRDVYIRAYTLFGYLLWYVLGDTEPSMPVQYSSYKSPL